MASNHCNTWDNQPLAKYAKEKVTIQLTTETKRQKAFIRTFCHGKHEKIKALEVIFPCSSVDSVANGVCLLMTPHRVRRFTSVVNGYRKRKYMNSWCSWRLGESNEYLWVSINCASSLTCPTLSPEWNVIRYQQPYLKPRMPTD